MPGFKSEGSGLPAGVRGVFASIVASIGFGLVYFLTPLLHPMPAEVIWGIRAAATLPLVTVVLLASRHWRLVAEIAGRARRRPWLILGMLATSLLMSIQMWIFAWAPLNGRAMQVALGYFLLPLVLVVVGRFLYKDRMAWWQWAAAGIALVGVAYEVVRIGGVSWETLTVALGYPAYFVLRRAMGMNHLGGMWWEFALMLPLAAVLIATFFADDAWTATNPSLWWSAPAISLLSGFAMLLYLVASRLLPMSLFGLLSYVEPAMLLVASLMIGERIASDEWFTYGAIWAAVLVLVLGGAAEVRRMRGK